MYIYDPVEGYLDDPVDQIDFILREQGEPGLSERERILCANLWHDGEYSLDGFLPVAS